MTQKLSQDHLESLTRQDLQILAKEHGIRANLGTKVIINKLLAVLPATADIEPKERPAESNANKRKRGGDAKTPQPPKASSRTKSAPVVATNKKGPAPPPKRRRVAEPDKSVARPIQAAARDKKSRARPVDTAVHVDEDSPNTMQVNVRGQLGHHAENNSKRHQELVELFKLINGMQKNVINMQPELAHHAHVREVVEEMLIVPMKEDRTLVDGSAFMAPGAAKKWREWFHENISYSETVHYTSPTNRVLKGKPAKGKAKQAKSKK